VDITTLHRISDGSRTSDGTEYLGSGEGVIRVEWLKLFFEFGDDECRFGYEVSKRVRRWIVRGYM